MAGVKRKTMDNAVDFVRKGPSMTIDRSAANLDLHESHETGESLEERDAYFRNLYTSELDFQQMAKQDTAFAAV
jgi:hypothetical protein